MSQGISSNGIDKFSQMFPDSAPEGFTINHKHSYSFPLKANTHWPPHLNMSVQIGFHCRILMDQFAEPWTLTCIHITLGPHWPQYLPPLWCGVLYIHTDVWTTDWHDCYICAAVSLVNHFGMVCIGEAFLHVFIRPITAYAIKYAHDFISFFVAVYCRLHPWLWIHAINSSFASAAFFASVNRVSIDSDNGLSPIRHQAIF